MNVAHLLLRGASRCGDDAPALASGARTTRTYGGLIERVRRLAAGLMSSGVGQGDRVALFMQNRPEYIEIMLATWWIGAAVVPVNAKLTAGELAVIRIDAEPRLIFVSPGLAAQCPQAIDVETTAYTTLFENGLGPTQPLETDALAWLFFTSGTTGRPKGAMIHHGALMAMTQGFLTDVDALPTGTPMLHFAPLSHGSGLYTLPCFAVGGTQVLPATPGFRPADVAALAAQWPGACFFAAPTMVGRLIQEVRATRIVPQGLRTIIYGGAPLYPADARTAAETLGPVFAQIYGQGESPMTITAQSRDTFTAALAQGDEPLLQSVGRPFLGSEIRIADTEDRPLATGEIGEILVRGPAVCMGYWNDPEATASTFRDGWLRTGDLGRLDPRGLLTLEGRSKEVIITGGSNVYPIEVETVLLDHPAVREAAVVGIPHPDWGEAVTAYVASDQNADTLARELDALCRDRIARFECPKTWHVRDALPKNAYGKIVKRNLMP